MPDHFVNTVDKFELKHALKLYARIFPNKIPKH